MVLASPVLSDDGLGHSHVDGDTTVIPHLHDILESQFAILVAAVLIDSLHGLLTESLAPFLQLPLAKILHKAVGIDESLLIREPLDKPVLFLECLPPGI